MIRPDRDQGFFRNISWGKIGSLRNGNYANLHNLSLIRAHHSFRSHALHKLPLFSPSKGACRAVPTTVKGNLDARDSYRMQVNPSRSQNMTVTCLCSPSILSLWDRFFSVRPIGKYFWIFSIFSPKEMSVGAGSEGWARLWPHSSQNLKVRELRKPHFEQFISNLFPHSTQNFIPSGFSNWQFGHFIIYVLQT